MKNLGLKLVGIAGVFMLATSTSYAATMLNDGGAVCEGPGGLLPGICTIPVELPTFGDGPNEPAEGPLIELTFSGSGQAHIYGGIRGKDENRFQDSFRLTGSGLYQFTLRALDFRRNEDFDADWSSGGSLIGTLINSGSEQVSELAKNIVLSDTPTQFVINAGGGMFFGGSVMEYELEIQAMPPVPLPAGGLLLLTGLGGLAFMRRKSRD